MIDQVGTHDPNRRVTTGQKLAKTIALILVVAVVGSIFALWSAFLLWAVYRLAVWLFTTLAYLF